MTRNEKKLLTEIERLKKELKKKKKYGLVLSPLNITTAKLNLMKNKHQIIPLLLSLALAHLAGLIGSLFTASSITTWYAGIAKPGFTPPGWLFGPVWLTLYTFMGIAAYLIWRERRHEAARFALRLYGAHLPVNALWSIVFFGRRDIGLGFVCRGLERGTVAP